MPTGWDEFKRKYIDDNITSLKPLINITIYGSYQPIEEKQLLLSLKAILIDEGYVNTMLVDDRQDPDLDTLEKSKMCLLYSDVNFLIFTKRGKRHGVARELAFVAEDERMRSKINHCVVFDQTPTKNSSSVPPLSTSDIKNAGINRRSFKTFEDLNEAIISEAYWQLRRLSPVLSKRR